MIVDLSSPRNVRPSGDARLYGDHLPYAYLGLVVFLGMQEPTQGIAPSSLEGDEPFPSDLGPRVEASASVRAIP